MTEAVIAAAASDAGDLGAVPTCRRHAHERGDERRTR
jgi:hypothetical protein